MNSILKFCLGFVLTLAISGSAKADAILNFSPEVLNPGNLTGSVVVQIATNAAAGTELVGAFNLDLQLSAFTGTLVGQNVTITSVIANFGSFLPAPTTPVSLSQGGTVNLQGFVSPPNNQITATPTNFFTINFSAPSAITTVDTFTVGFANTTSNSIANTNFQGIFGSAGSQLVAVPEPSSALLGLGLMGGVLLRRRRVA